EADERCVAAQSFARLKSTIRCSFLADADARAVQCGQGAICGMSAIRLSGSLRTVNRPLQLWQRSTASQSCAVSGAGAEAKSDDGTKRYFAPLRRACLPERSPPVGLIAQPPKRPN